MTPIEFKETIDEQCDLSPYTNCNFLKKGYYSGFWREYFSNGKIKHEAEYKNNDLVNNSYYIWTKKGEKYLIVDTEKTFDKKIGKVRVQGGIGKGTKIKVKEQ